MNSRDAERFAFKLAKTLARAGYLKVEIAPPDLIQLLARYLTMYAEARRKEK